MIRWTVGGQNRDEFLSCAKQAIGALKLDLVVDVSDHPPVTAEIAQELEALRQFLLTKGHTLLLKTFSGDDLRAAEKSFRAVLSQKYGLQQELAFFDQAIEKNKPRAGAAALDRGADAKAKALRQSLDTKKEETAALQAQLVQLQEALDQAEKAHDKFLKDFKADEKKQKDPLKQRLQELKKRDKA